MNIQDDAGFGCPAFGHLASAFIDGELPHGEGDRFTTHLPGCGPCQSLCAQYRAIDVAAMPAYPRPLEGEWDAAWMRISRTVATDREEAARSPVGQLWRFLDGLVPTSPWMRPLAYAGAAAMLVVLALAIQQATQGLSVPESIASRRPVPPVATASLASGDGLRVECQSGWDAVVFTLDGDDPATVIQCQPVEA